ncbi:glycerol-3-phosphate acyltransferase, partial [Megasphaera sp.]
MMLGILCLVLAYIAGSFPSGLVIGKALYHTDIRDYGSHNTGATNAYRVLGAVGGLLVLICDVAKGMLGVYLGQVASQSGLGSTDTQIYFMIAG